MLKKNLKELTEFIDSVPCECDGASRLIHLRLLRQKVPHVCRVGVVIATATDEVAIPIHWWIETDGKIIDYRARMWIGEDAPHGVFTPESCPAFAYVGEPTEFGLAGCLALEAVLQ